MKKKLLPLFIVIVCTIFLLGCDIVGDIVDDFIASLLAPPTVDLLELSEAVTAPVRGEMPSRLPIATKQYTGTVKWQTGDGAEHTGSFNASTVYKAVVTLSAIPGFTFDGIAANSFTYAGAVSVSNSADSGVVTITFASTAAEGQDTQVTMRDLTEHVTAPEKGKTPVTKDINTGQYTGKIAWQTANGAAHTGSFAAGTAYRAVVTLTAKANFTFDGLGANAFIHTGASSVSNNSGTVTINFSATNEGSSNLSTTRQDVLNEARKYLGVPYVSPASPPNSFDCSSFVRHVYSQLGNNTLPQTSSGYASFGTQVPWSGAEPGDLVVFSSVKGGSTIDHVAILYEKGNSNNAAGSLIIHAASVKIGSSFVEGNANTQTGVLISKLGVYGGNLNTPDSEYFYQRIKFYVRVN